MRILIDIGHPAHVHLFKNMIWELENKGHEILISARDKDVAMPLLNVYNLEYESRGNGSANLFGKALAIAQINRRIYKMAKKFKPDILIGVHNPYIAQVSKLIRKPSIIFTDTEHGKLASKLTFPFASVICTPSCFAKDLGKKQVRYKGYQELAYLHPTYFKPDPTVLDELGLSKDDKFVILRFVSWGASHDVGEKGFDLETKKGYISELERYGKVFITSETNLVKELDKYKISISPEEIHHLLYYATLYVGEGATMATEAGILGTPSIYVSPLVGTTMGNLKELGRYGLVYSFADQKQGLEKAISLLKKNDLNGEWQCKRKKFLKEKVDVTKWMLKFIGNYPESFYELKRLYSNPKSAEKERQIVL